MGRPSLEIKRAKRKRQKNKRHSNSEIARKGPLNDTHCEFSSTSDDTVQDSSPSPSDNSVNLGDADMDLVEMELYDLYREDDGEQHTLEYLQKCNSKLKAKVTQDKILQRLNMKIKAEKLDEVERIRCFYETIAFGRSRAGQMVRTARGRSCSAHNIANEMRELYSVRQDINFR